eukprot:scaffold190049_cov18-Tisochrysis_lutea.AAC.1
MTESLSSATPTAHTAAAACVVCPLYVLPPQYTISALFSSSNTFLPRKRQYLSSARCPVFYFFPRSLSLSLKARRDVRTWEEGRDPTQVPKNSTQPSPSTRDEEGRPPPPRHENKTNLADKKTCPE